MPSERLRIRYFYCLRKRNDILFNMKTMKSLLATTALATATPGIAEVTNSETCKPKPYEYSMNLDVAELIKIEYRRPTPLYCGVVPAEMTYRDSNGKIKVVEYLYPDTSGCTD
ncbi:DUF2790 domain-containing protein [Azotobacter sp. CWF10]